MRNIWTLISDCKIEPHSELTRILSIWWWFWSCVWIKRLNKLYIAWMSHRSPRAAEAKDRWAHSILSRTDEIYDWLWSPAREPHLTSLLTFFARLNNGKNNWFCLFILVRWMSEIQSNKKKVHFLFSYCISFSLSLSLVCMRCCSARLTGLAEMRPAHSF